MCGRACGVAVGFFLEKQLASLRHLFPAKNPTTTPRRRALAGIRLIKALVVFFRSERERIDSVQRSRLLRDAFFAFTLGIPVMHVGRGVWGIFLAGKKMSERSELFFPEEKYPIPPVPAP
jgi:hypothetical protein